MLSAVQIQNTGESRLPRSCWIHFINYLIVSFFNLWVKWATIHLEYALSLTDKVIDSGTCMYPSVPS